MTTGRINQVAFLRVAGCRAVPNYTWSRREWELPLRAGCHSLATIASAEFGTLAHLCFPYPQARASSLARHAGERRGWFNKPHYHVAPDQLLAGQRQ